MAKVFYAPLAENDLVEIAAFTARHWSLKQADRYIADLEAACDALAANPSLGRAHKGRRPRVLRFEHQSHVIFYELTLGGVLVGRILHSRMHPMRHGL